MITLLSAVVGAVVGVIGARALPDHDPSPFAHAAVPGSSTTRIPLASTVELAAAGAVLFTVLALLIGPSTALPAWCCWPPTVCSRVIPPRWPGRWPGRRQDERGDWMAQPVVNDTGIGWGRAYARDRYRASTPQKALRLTTQDMHLRAEVTERLHRERGSMNLADNAAPAIYSAITLESAHDSARTTIVTMDDPKRPSTFTEIIAEQRRMPNGKIQRGIVKDGQSVSADQFEEKFGARHGQVFDALHGAAIYVAVSVYGDGTSVASGYSDATDQLKDGAEGTGYTAFTSRRIDLSDDAQQYSTPTVRCSSETKHHFGSVEIAGDTGEVQRYFQSRPVDEFPAAARKFRQMETFALERTEQAKEINRLAATGLAQ